MSDESEEFIQDSEEEEDAGAFELVEEEVDAEEENLYPEDEDDDDEDFEDKSKKPAKSTRSSKATPSKIARTQKQKTTKKEGGKVSLSLTKKKPSAKSSCNKSLTAADVDAYMFQSNRPYSLINVHDNLHRAIPKPVLGRMLDELVDSNRLCAKVYGKNKIYFPNQVHLPVPSKEEQQTLETDIAATKTNREKLEVERKTCQSEYNFYTTSLSDEQLAEALLATEAEFVTLSTEREALVLEQQQHPPASPTRKHKLVQHVDHYRMAWKKRRNLTKQAVEMIAEGMEKKSKAIYELCCLETDEEAGVDESKLKF